MGFKCLFTLNNEESFVPFPQGPLPTSKIPMNSVKLTVFYDGRCPLCKREVNFLQKRNQEGNLKFIDIDSSDIQLYEEYGITYRDAMEKIHAIKSDGSIIKDIKVFENAYNLIGLGWIYAPLKFKFIDKFVGFIYSLWARHRLKITLRPSLEKLCDKKNFHGLN